MIIKLQTESNSTMISRQIYIYTIWVHTTHMRPIEARGVILYLTKINHT